MTTMQIYHHRSNDITSGILHAIGLGLSIAALILMIIFAGMYGSGREIVAVTIFGSGLICLYTASSLYHLFPPRWKRAKQVFRKLDYSMIFVLIAATYTPICLIGIRGGWGWSLFGISWGFVLIGSLLQISRWRIPFWIYLTMYLSLGWLLLIALNPLLRTFSVPALFWLFFGGAVYTIGVLFCAFDKLIPRLKIFGFHEIFHVFVLGGSFSHFWLVFHYLL